MSTSYTFKARIVLLSLAMLVALPSWAQKSCNEVYGSDKTARPKVVVISGTNRDGSMTLKVAQMMTDKIRAQGLDVQLIDIALVPPSTYAGDGYFKTSKSFQKKYDDVISRADGLFIVFPEYHGTYPGILGTFMNYVQAPFQGKSIAMIGLSAGILGGQKGAEHLSSTLRHRKAEIVGEAQVNIPQIEGKMKDSQLVDAAVLKRLEASINVMSQKLKSAYEKQNQLEQFLDVLAKAPQKTSVVMNSDVHVVGNLTAVVRDQNGKNIYMKWTGPTELRDQHAVIDGQGTAQHFSGFSMPVGKVKNKTATTALSQMKSPEELSKLGLVVGQRGELAYESGVMVAGIVKELVFSQNGQLQIIKFTDATVTYGTQAFFKPSWGEYDMVIAEQVLSVQTGL